MNYNYGDKSIQFLDLRVENSEKLKMIEAFTKVLDHGQLVMGPEVYQFENMLAQYCQRKYCTAVGSGTTAVYLALKALDLKPGDEVITSSLSWIATANAIALNGAQPVFADINDDLNISTDSVAHLITSKTKAILSVDYTGKLADIVSLTELSSSHNLKLVADASQAFGASRFGKVSGSYGDIAAISHNPMKVLGALGEAGSVLTDDLDTKERLDILRYNGTINKEYLVTPSLNGRMSTLR